MEVLNNLQAPKDDNVLLGIDLADDGGVYRLSEDRALIQTVDYFTPIVDDPYHYGAIACANSISDVYAMGGEPKSALNIVCFPTEELGLSVLQEILQGALDTAEQGDFSIIGGHCVRDDEPKYGLSVNGFVHPDQLITKKNASPGDRLIMTKPIGTGMITTAIKKGTADDRSIAQAVSCMKHLNDTARDAAVHAQVQAGTDITGYGLLGHLFQILKASDVAAELDFDRVPLLPGVKKLAEDECFPGGTRDNYHNVRSYLQLGEGIDKNDVMTLSDAQTSGGLLLAVPESNVDMFLEEMQPGPSFLSQGAEIIGTIRKGEPSIRIY